MNPASASPRRRAALVAARLALEGTLLVALLGVPAAVAATVTVLAVQEGHASELGPTPGLFQFTRTGDTAQPLSVGFTLAGTATRNADYLSWETRAEFAAGSDHAFVTVLPTHDAEAEGTETVALTLSPGPGYTVGSPASATVRIADQYVQGATGVFDSTMTDPGGLPLIAPDLTYLDAWIADGALHLVVGLVNAHSLVNNLEIFLNTDQRADTGDWRPGHVAGQEFRVHATTGFLAGYELYRLPTEAPADPRLIEQDTRVHAANGSALEGGVGYSIPLARLGDPTAVDVFVATHIGAAQIQHRGIGDRLPKFGALDTRTRQVVVRRPARTLIGRVADVAGDVNRLGFDLRLAELDVVADQFTLAFSYGASFDPANPTRFPGPSGEALLDSDARLLTGAFPMGATIPTWGADCAFQYDLSTPSPVFLLVPFSTGQSVTFGQDRNDGRWLSSTGHDLVFSGSVSLLDPLRVGSGLPTPQRVATDGRMVLQAVTFNERGRLDPNGVADRAPDDARALDAATGRALEPLAWSSARTVAQDPLDYPGPPISGQDITQIEAEVIQQHLVIKVTLSSWLATDVGNLFRLALDADLDAATAPLGTLRHGTSPALGVDYDLSVSSADAQTGAPVYPAFLRHPDGSTLRVDATVLARPDFQAARPGGFTVAIPLEALAGAGPQIRFYVTTGRLEGADAFDVAPPEPVVVSLAPHLAPTLTTQPESQTVAVGATVVFRVAATGTAPLAYQWRKDGADLPGATAPTLTLADVRSTDAGRYAVVVSNLAGRVTSHAATLTVTALESPRHPADQAPADDRITLQEMVAYATAYKRSAPWPAGPHPVPLDYLIRAATLYKRGERYRYDPGAGPLPLSWVNTTSP